MSAFIIVLLSLVLPPCATEDSANCGWDATIQGDGTGSSFIDIDGDVYYLP